jgi:hypothetical protein
LAVADRLQPHQRRQTGETMAQWANRLRIERGIIDGVQWVEGKDGTLSLRGIRNPQSKLDLDR